MRGFDFLMWEAKGHRACCFDKSKTKLLILLSSAAIEGSLLSGESSTGVPKENSLLMAQRVRHFDRSVPFFHRPKSLAPSFRAASFFGRLEKIRGPCSRRKLSNSGTRLSSLRVTMKEPSFAQAGRLSLSASPSYPITITPPGMSGEPGYRILSLKVTPAT